MNSESALLDLATTRDRLRQILSQTLRLDPRELTDERRFLELATSSLELVDAFSRISTTFGVQPSLRRIFHDCGDLNALSTYVQALVEEVQREGGAEEAPVAEGEATPFSPNQSWRYFLSQLQPGARQAWTETALIELRGQVDTARLERAWLDLCARHPLLGARVAGGEALVPGDAPSLIVSRGEAPGAWLARPHEGGLVSAELLVSSPVEALLRVNVSELLADRAALHSLVSELGQLYGRRRLAPMADVPAPPARVSPELQSWWRDQLRGRSTTDLPADQPRPAIKRYTGRRLIVPLDRAGWTEDATHAPYLHVLTAFAVLISRICASEELLIGLISAPITSTLAGGPRPLGNLSNPVPLPLDLDLSRPFAALRDEVRARLLDVMDHADLPFPSLVSALEPERDQGRSPIFTVAFDRELWPALDWGELDAALISSPGGGARYDLHLTLVEAPGQLQLQLDYDGALFEQDTMRRWAAGLRRLAQAAAAQPETAAGALPLMSPELAASLRSLGQGERLAPDAQPLHAAFFARAEAAPDELAILWADRRVSNRELAEMAMRVAGAVADRGLGAGDRVGVLMSRRPEAIAALLGVLASGAAYVPLDPAYPPARIQGTAADAQLPLVLVEAGLEAALPPGTRSLRVGPDALDLGAPPLLPRSSAPEDPAYLIYTSGSTGQPKGVVIPHQAARNLVRWALGAFSEADRAVVLASTSFTFDLSIFEIFATLSGAGALALVDSAVELHGHPAAGSVTLINTVPSAMSELLRQGPLPAALRVANLAGEPLRRELVDRIYREPGVERVYNLYGPSETTTYSSFALIPRAGGEPSIGRAVASTTLTLRDSRGQLSPPGGIGELWIGGAGVALGYFGRPEQSAERFVPDPDAPGQRAYRTGDFGRWGADGELRFLGRRDDQVKVRGFRIELGAIEAALLGHPVLAEVTVGVRGAGEDRRLVAWLARDPSVLVVHSPDWRAWLSSRLPAYMIPAAFVELPALPRLPNGKVDRQALPAPELAREARVGGDYVAPQSELERVLAAIWARQLGLERVGVHDDYFALGGDSLMLTSLMLEIKGRLGVRVTLAEFFDNSTVATLAGRLRELARDKVNRTLVRRRIARTGPEVDAWFERLAADAQLDDDLQASAGPPPALRELFVTGATGFVGAHTFYELLTRTDLRLRVMVRCKHPDEGRARLRRAMEGYGLWRPEHDGRFEVVPGDLGRPRLGLDEARYAALANEVDGVLHMAANVNFLYPYHALKPINVDGVREMVRLCFAGRTKPFHYMSTAALWPMGARFRFFEDSDLHHRVRLNLGYDESKWVAEVLVAQAKQRGLPVSVYRPGEVSGHSVSGRCVLDHFMFAIMKGSIQMGVFPDVKGYIDMAPVDYVAAATAALVNEPSALGGVYQLNNPKPGVPRQMIALLDRIGYRSVTVPMEEWVTTLMLREDLAENALYPFIAVLEEFEEENLQFPRYDTTKATAALGPLGVGCPPVSDELLLTYIRYFREVGFLPPPSGGAR